MVTEIGKYLRALRARSGENLVEMSTRISLSPGMVSGIETGKRNIPKSFVNRLTNAYGLSDAEIDRLLFAIAETNNEVIIDLNGIPRPDRKLAFRFAMALPNMDAEKKLAILKLISDPANGQEEAEEAAIELAGGAVKTVPRGTVTLNPERTGLCNYLYIAWFFPEDEPSGPIEALQGRRVGPLYAYASDRNDLHKYGVPHPSFESEKERVACSREASSLMGMMLEESPSAYSEVGPSQSLQFSWVDIDDAFETSPRIGTSMTVSRF